MTRMLNRRRFLSGVVGLTLFGAGLAEAGAPQRSLRPVPRSADLLKRLQPDPEGLIAAANLGGKVGFAVADARSGDVLEVYGAEDGLPPASVAKALTAGYALAHLGEEHRFETRVLATGPVVEGIVQGDLVLAGSGDPTLDTDALADLAGQLGAAGVRGATGGLKLWDGALPYVRGIDALQPDHVGYNPAISGLNLNFNRVHFEWRRSGGDYRVTMDARSAAHRPQVRMARMVVEARSTPVYTYRDAGGYDAWTVARGALGESGARWLPVRKPALYAGEVFRSLAQGVGIRLEAAERIPALPEGTVLARYRSAALPDMLRDMLRFSTNITAEAVGLAATAARRGTRAASLEDSAAEMAAWAAEALGVPGMVFVDHSGLGDRSRVQAGAMLAALQALHRSQPVKPLLRSFAMRDAQRRIIEDHPIKVLAKTGTLNFVSGLAGYIDLPDGRELAFAIFAADMPRRSALSKAERERPPGGRSWNVRAKTLQQALIERWGVLYSA